MTSQPTVVILGTASWAAPIATNQHYVARELAKSCNVIFLEGVGTRSLTLSWADFRRVLERLRSSEVRRQAQRPIPPNLTVARIWLLPLHNRFAEAINKTLTHFHILRLRRERALDVLWTFTPYVYGAHNRFKKIIYHLVDLIYENPRVDAQYFQKSERELAGATGHAIATSEAISQHLAKVGFSNIITRPNVADLEAFESVHHLPETAPQVVAFAGQITESKLDFDLLVDLANSIRQLNAVVVCVGPIDTEHTASNAVQRLRDAGIHLQPTRPLSEVAELYGTASVGLIPYSLNALTIGITPLKLYEYLAVGLPVVSTALPSVPAVPHAIWVEQSHSDFVRRVKHLLGNDAKDNNAERRAIAARHGWGERGAEYRQLVHRLINQSD